MRKRRTYLTLKKKDILLVKDPDIISEKTIDRIRGDVEVVFYKKPISKKIESKLPFIFIDANKVNIEENEYFGIIDKEEFDKVKNKKTLLHKIVKDYRKERLL